MEKQRLSRQTALIESSAPSNNTTATTTMTNSTTLVTPNPSNTTKKGNNGALPALNPVTHNNAQESTVNGRTASNLTLQIPHIPISSSAGSGPPTQHSHHTTTSLLETFTQQHTNHHRVTLHTGNNGGTVGGHERPFLLNLAHFQSAGGLIILNGKPAATALASAVTKANSQHLHHSTTFAALHNTK